jgi:hypothetical protein
MESVASSKRFQLPTEQQMHSTMASDDEDFREPKVHIPSFLTGCFASNSRDKLLALQNATLCLQSWKHMSWSIATSKWTPGASTTAIPETWWLNSCVPEHVPEWENICQPFPTGSGGQHLFEVMGCQEDPPWSGHLMFLFFINSQEDQPTNGRQN